MKRCFVLGIYHPTSDTFYENPLEQVENYGSLANASWLFRQRAAGISTVALYVASQPKIMDWGHSENPYLDLWFADVIPEEPYVPDIFDRRLSIGPRGGVRRENF